MGVIDSFCVAMLRKYGKVVNIPNNFTILLSSDEAEIVNIVKAEIGKKKFEQKGFPPSARIVDIISQATNKGKPISVIMEERRYVDYAGFVDDVIEIGKAVSNYKIKNALLNYDDLLVYMNKLLSGYPEITRKIARSYPYIMVDEYQDTNQLQESILQFLFEFTKNIAVVGDDMQSLYAFRGAEVQNIIDFPNRFPGCRKIYLTQNYRSNQEILDLSNSVVKHASEGYLKELSATHSAGYLPKLKRPLTQYDEAEDILQEIKERHESGVQYNEICVLFRSSYQSMLLENKLVNARIPYVKYGGVKFFEQAHIKDVLSYLRIAVNPMDEIAWFRALKVHYGIGDTYARDIAAGCKEHGMEWLLNSKYSRRKYFTELKSLHAELCKYDKLPFERLLNSAIEFYMKVKEQNIKAMKTNEGNRTELLEFLKVSIYEDLMALADMATNYETISDFVDALVLDNTKLTQEQAEEGQVVLSTIHSVKGLEFDSVIIMDCIDEVFPSTSEDEIGTKEDNEELRCFYVAITRAKKRLTLYAPWKALKFGRPIEGNISHYLSGADNLMEYPKPNPCVSEQYKRRQFSVNIWE